MVRRFALVLLLSASPLAAQASRTHFAVHLATQNALAEGPTITSEGVLSDSKTRELLRNGFPARMHYRLELWKKGRIFDDPSGREEWDVLVAYDPTANRYNVVRQSRGGQVRENFGAFESVTGAEMQINKAFQSGLHPTRSGSFYYHLIVEMEMVSLTDLDELQQWLRGSNGDNAIGVVRSGIGTLVSRVLGGSTRTEEQHTEIFRVP